MATTPKGDDRALRDLIVTDLARRIVQASRRGRGKGRRPKPMPVTALYPNNEMADAMRPRLAAMAARDKRTGSKR